MKRTKSEKTENKSPEVYAESEEDYPYGLEIRMEKESLGKLGLDIDDFSINTKVDIVCQAEVTHLSESVSSDDSHSSASFQITDMAIEVRPKSEKLKDVINLAKSELLSELKAGV
jgi:hypothetical protein